MRGLAPLFPLFLVFQCRYHFAPSTEKESDGATNLIANKIGKTSLDKRKKVEIIGSYRLYQSKAAIDQKILDFIDPSI